MADETREEQIRKRVFDDDERRAYCLGVLVPNQAIDDLAYLLEENRRLREEAALAAGATEHHAQRAELMEPEGGVGLIAAERHRQISVEGWTAEHDDGHRRGELAQAALAYLYAGLVAHSGSMDDWFKNPRTDIMEGPASPVLRWPWDLAAWKPSDDPTRNLVRAGALIAAEIDRLQRATLAQGAGDGR